MQLELGKENARNKERLPVYLFEVAKVKKDAK